jgi:predicted methyltransferase
MFSIKDISEYIVLLIAAFAKHYSMTDAEAYRYLNRYGAIKVAHDFYDVMHTQPMDDMVKSISTYCQRKGGYLC